MAAAAKPRTQRLKKRQKNQPRQDVAFATDGKAFAVDAINTIMRVYALNATSGAASAALATVDFLDFFADVAPYPDAAQWSLSDPIVLWDKLAARWIVA